MPAIGTIAAASLGLAACGGLIPKAKPTTADLLRDGSDKVCIAPDVQTQLRQQILRRAVDGSSGSASPPDAAALSAVSLTYERTALLSFDKTVVKASCSTTVRFGGELLTPGALPLHYTVSPAAEDGAQLVVGAEVADADKLAQRLGASGTVGAAAAAAPDTRAAGPPTITSAWLVGIWSSNDIQRDMNACDTDSVVSFASDGSYHDGGGYGRFRTDGSTITYYGRVLVDVAEDSEDRSKFDQPLVTKVVAIDKRSFREDGDPLYRCEGK